MRVFGRLLCFAVVGSAVSGCTTGGKFGDDDGNNGNTLPPLVGVTEGYATRPEGGDVALPGATISIDQLYALPDPGETIPGTLLGAGPTGDPHIRVIVTQTDNTVFPAAEGEVIDGLNMYVNGFALEPDSVTERTWSWYVERSAVPITLVPSHFMQWELRGWKYGAAPVQDGGTADAGHGEPREVKLLYRAAVELPPGSGGGAGFPNFISPTPGQTLAAAGSLTVTWEPLGLQAFLGQTIRVYLDGWIAGTPPDFIADPAREIQVDESLGTLTFNSGVFSDWDWVSMRVDLPLPPNEAQPMHVATARRVNQ